MFFERERPPSSRIPMLDWRDIRPAQEMRDPSCLSPQARKRLYQLYSGICRINDFSAVAGTQIPDEVLGEFAEWRNVIYMRGDKTSSLENALLFNPQFRIKGKRGISLEGCGSIGESKVGFLAKRALSGFLTCIGYRPSCGLFILEDDEIYGQEAIILDHENEHKEGGSIVTNPNKLVSLADPILNREGESIYTVSIPELLTEHITRGFYTSWLTKEGDQIYQMKYVGMSPPHATWDVLLHGDWEKTPLEVY